MAALSRDTLATIQPLKPYSNAVAGQIADMYIDRTVSDLRDDSTWRDLYRWLGRNLEILYSQLTPKRRQELDQKRERSK
jgi:hypothetical protein